MPRSAKADAPVDTSQEAIVYEQVRGHLRYENDGTGTMEIYARVRVQSFAGVQKAGLLIFNYNSANEAVDVKVLRVTKPDGQVVNADPEAVQDMTAPVAQAAPMYSDFRQKHVVVPNLSPGDILEYRTLTSTTKPLTPGQFWQVWNFISDDICLDEQVELNAPKSRPIKSSAPDGIALTTRDQGDRRLYLWTTSNHAHAGSIDLPQAKFDLRALLRGPRVAIPRRLFVTTFQSWTEVATWYSDLERDRRVPSAEVRAKADELVRGATNDREKVEAVYRYVARNIRYISLSFGVGRYQPHAAAEVLAHQYGDCKDKATLLEAMLDAEGIQAFTVLLNTGAAIDPQVPMPLQFDHAISYLRLDGQDIWLDSTAGVAPFGYLLPQVRGKQVLVANSTHFAELTKIPDELPMPELYSLEVNGSVDNARKLDAQIIFETRGDLEVLSRSLLLQLPLSKLNELMAAGAKQANPSADIEFSDLTASDPFETIKPLRVSMRIKSTLPESEKKDKESKSAKKGSGRVVPEDVLSFLLPIVASGSKGPSSLGQPKELKLKIRFSIDAKDVKSLPLLAPKPVHLVNEFATYDSEWSLNGLTVQGEFHLVVRAKSVPSEKVNDYAAFRSEVGKSLSSMADLRPNDPAALAVSSAVAPSPSPASARAEYDAGLRAYKNNECAAAAKFFQKSLQDAPEFTGAWNELGRAFNCLREYQKAVDAYQKAIAANPNEPYAYNNLGLAYWNLYKYDDAIKAFRKQLEVSPKDRFSPLNLGRLYLLMEDAAAAVPELQAASINDPASASAQIALGRAYARLAQPEKASEAFDRAVTLDQGWLTLNDTAYDMSDANLNLERAAGYATLAVAQKEKELKLLKLDALKIQDLPKIRQMAASWDTFGWVKFRQGDFAAAKKYIDAAADISASSTISWHRGQILEQQGRKDEAIAAYAEALAAASSPSGDSAVDSGTSPLRTEKRILTRDEREAHAHLAKLLGSDSAVESRLQEAARKRDARRTVDAAFSGAKDEHARLLVVLGPGAKIADSRRMDATASVVPLLDLFQSIALPQAFPDSALDRIPRAASLDCLQSTHRCVLVLLPAETAASVFPTSEKIRDSGSTPSEPRDVKLVKPVSPSQ